MNELTQKNQLYQYFEEKNIDIIDFLFNKLTDKDYVENNFAFVLQVLEDNRNKYFKNFFNKYNQEHNCLENIISACLLDKNITEKNTEIISYYIEKDSLPLLFIKLLRRLEEKGKGFKYFLKYQQKPENEQWFEEQLKKINEENLNQIRYLYEQEKQKSLEKYYLYQAIFLLLSPAIIFLVFFIGISVLGFNFKIFNYITGFVFAGLSFGITAAIFTNYLYVKFLKKEKQNIKGKEQLENFSFEYFFNEKVSYLFPKEVLKPAEDLNYSDLTWENLSFTFNDLSIEESHKKILIEKENISPIVSQAIEELNSLVLKNKEKNTQLETTKIINKYLKELNTFSLDFLKEQEIEIVKTLKKLHEKLSQEIDYLNEKQKIEFKILNKKTVE